MGGRAERIAMRQPDQLGSTFEAGCRRHIFTRKTLRRWWLRVPRRVLIANRRPSPADGWLTALNGRELHSCCGRSEAAIIAAPRRGASHKES